MTIRNRRMFSWALALSLALLPVAGRAQLAGLPAVESGGWVIRLIRMERSGSQYGEYTFTLSAQPRDGGPERQLRLRNETTGLQRLEVVGDRLVVFGEVAGAGDQVSILELATGKLSSSFLCRGPELSPKRRYLAFRAYYPRFADPQATSDVLVLVDLSAAGPPVARPVFPPENAASGQAGSWVEKESERHAIEPMARYRFDAAESRLAFVDRVNDELWLVVLRLDRGEPRAVHRSRLDLSSALAISATDPATAAAFEQERRNAAIEDLTFRDDRTIVLRLSRERWASERFYRSNQLVVNLDDANEAGAAP